jgi:hypothetical protein
MEHKTTKYFKYAIGEIVLVVIGILIALQINNWNDSRKQGIQEQLILKKLAIELSNDIIIIQEQINIGKVYVAEIKYCLDVLSNQKESTKTEFNKNFSNSLVMLGFDINRTTFNGITESRTIDYINNSRLVDSLNAFYNSNYKGWDNAIKDYTRNVIGPFLMNFDHLPQVNYDNYGGNSSGFLNSDFTRRDITKFEVPQKSLEDYKNSIFIINLLRQRLLLVEGQILHYGILEKKMARLVNSITKEINSH